MNRRIIAFMISMLVVSVSSWAQTMSAEWKSMKPEELQCKPVDLFANQWMALAMGNKEKMNSMTIAWGTIGELWSKPVVIVYVSSSRYSKKLMDANDYFTVTAFPDTDKSREALVYIGTHSQSREPEKTKNAGLTAQFTPLGNPVFAEANLAIECKKIYADEFKEDMIPDDVKTQFYNGRNGLHTFYIGEIVNVWTK